MDDLERRVRRARPLSGHRDLPLTDRAKRDLADIILSAGADLRRRPTRARRRPPAGLLVAMLSTMVVIVVAPIGFILGQAEKHTSNTDQTVSVLRPLATRSPSSGGEYEFLPPDDDVISDGRDRSFSYQSWDVAETSSMDAISPVIHVITHDEDGSRTETVVTPSLEDEPPADLRGLPLVEEKGWGPGEFVSPYLAPVPSDVEKVDAYLASIGGYKKGLSGDKALRTVAELLKVQRINSTQCLTLVASLVARSDIAVSGEVTDREGREGLALTTTSVDAGQEQPSLVVSPDGTRILGFELVRKGAERDGTRVSAVVSYIIWLDDAATP